MQWRINRNDWKEIGSMSAPIFVEQLALAFIGLLVSMLVKRTGLAAVAAVNMLNIVNQLFQQIFMAVGVAVTVAVSQHRGGGDLVSTGKSAVQSNTLSLLFSLALSLFCFVFIHPILRLILVNSEALVYQYATTYMYYLIASMPFLSIYFITTAAIRGSGKPNLSLIAALVNNGSYALMSILAVVWFDAGIVGVSMAMLLSRVLSAIAGLYLFKRGNENLKVPHVFTFKFESKIIKPVIGISIPICLENMLFQLGKLVTQTFAVPFGTNATAVNGIVSNLFGLLVVPGATASNAITPIVGRYIGMKNFAEAKKKSVQLIMLSTVVAVFVCILGYWSAPAFARFYSAIPQVQKEIISVNALCCLVMPFTWSFSFVTPAALRGAGDVRFTTIVAVLSMLFMRVGSSYILTIVLRMGVQGIWIGMYLDWVVRIIFFHIRFHGQKWLQKGIV